ncbi:MAG: hypothetical protein ACREMB_27090 [Candidatus Rokuibacteriota bacterium]
MLDVVVRIEGHLIIRWHEQGFDLRFVPAHGTDTHETATLRLDDPAALESLLTRVGLERDRIVEVLSSPYVLHSIRLRMDPRTARRAGLVPGPGRRALDLLGGVLRGPARLLARLRSRP